MAIANALPLEAARRHVIFNKWRKNKFNFDWLRTCAECGDDANCGQKPSKRQGGGSIPVARIFVAGVYHMHSLILRFGLLNVMEFRGIFRKK